MNELLEAAEAVCDRWDSPDWKDGTHTGGHIKRLRAAIAAYKEAEPVAYRVSDDRGIGILLDKDFAAAIAKTFNCDVAPLYTSPRPRRLTEAELADHDKKVRVETFLQAAEICSDLGIEFFTKKNAPFMAIGAEDCEAALRRRAREE